MGLEFGGLAAAARVKATCACAVDGCYRFVAIVVIVIVLIDMLLTCRCYDCCCYSAHACVYATK